MGSRALRNCSNLVKLITQVDINYKRAVSGHLHRSCVEVDFAKRYAVQRLENACERALYYNHISATLIKSILDGELDYIRLMLAVPRKGFLKVTGRETILLLKGV